MSTTNRARMARAYAQVLLAGTLWATSGPFSIALHRLGVPPSSVALLRPAVGGAFLGILLVVISRPGSAPRPSALAGMLLGGGLIVGVFQLAFQMSTEAVGVPATVAMLYLAPAFVVVASSILFSERLTPAKGVLALISVVGVWLAVFGARGVDVSLDARGIVWGCLCGLSYGSYILFGKRLGPSHGSLAPLFWSTAGGTGFLALFHALGAEALVLPGTALAWAVLALFGVLTIAASALLLFNAMRALEAGRASIGTTVEPLVATLLAVTFLDQVLTPMGWFGLGLLVTGVAGAYAWTEPGPGLRAGEPDAPPRPG